MYKLVAVDLDGTLLDDNKNIDIDTINSIKEAIDKGTYFVIASGRPVITLKRFYDLIDRDMPVISCNGAVLAYPSRNEIILNEHFKKEDLMFLVKYFNDSNKSFIAWSNNDLYCNKINIYTTSYHDACKHADVKIKVIEDYNDFYKLYINKLIVIDDSDKIQVFLKDVKKDIKDRCNYFTSQSYFLEFVSSGIDKGKALEKLSKYLDIEKEEIIAIGDGHNDLSMIEYAHVGVAMENSSEYVKSKADYISASNNNQGVKKVLDKFILGVKDEKSK